MANRDQDVSGDARFESHLERGRRGYTERAWRDAYASLSAADAAGTLPGGDLERLMWSAALIGRDRDMLAVAERLFQRQSSDGQCLAAAKTAFWLGFRLFAMGEPARAGGWHARAQRLIEREEGDCAVRGYLMIPRVHQALSAGSLDVAAGIAAEAAALGERFDEPDLCAFARQLQGRALVRQARIDEGLRLIDEAMVAASAGELSPIMTGLVYCSAITTCQRVYALGRAREWTAALARWCASQPQLATFSDTCLVHRAEVLQLGGDWAEAAEEAQRACDRSAATETSESLGDGHYQRGEIHRLRGAFADAEAAYEAASRHGRDPQPGLALVRLAQGRGDAAEAAVRRALAANTDPLARARYLPAAVEVLLATGHPAEARAACEELDAVARRFHTPLLAVMAAHARGACLYASGDAASAIEPLGRAFEGWRDAAAPHLAACVRVTRGRACRALGDDDGARLEWEAARRTFAQLGATPDLAAVDSLLGTSGSSRPHGLTQRELEVIRLVARGKTNKGIARELGVSERTVDRHVSNILSKLDLPSRSAATAFAYEHRLV